MTEVASAVAAESAFSTTAILDAVLSVPHAALNALHDTVGLPWFVAIPTAALLVRACIIVPFIQIPLRKSQQRLVDLTPIRRASAALVTSQKRDVFVKLGLNAARAETASDIRHYDSVLQSRWRVSRLGTIGRGLAQIPVFLVMAETIRRMSGAPRGLLDTFLGETKPDEQASQVVADAPVSEMEKLPASSLAERSLESSADHTPRAEEVKASTAQESSAASLEEQLDHDVDATTALADSIQSTSMHIDRHPWFEPTFATEGWLWFTDLTVRDPTLNLPFLVCGMMLFNFSFNSSTVSKSDAKVPKPSTIGRKVIQTFFILLAPFLIPIPAGVLWYWFSSTSFAMISSKLLEKLFPTTPPPEACSRPLILTAAARKNEQGTTMF